MNHRARFVCYVAIIKPFDSILKRAMKEKKKTVHSHLEIVAHSPVLPDAIYIYINLIFNSIDKTINKNFGQ